jgi:hypothetical protein
MVIDPEPSLRIPAAFMLIVTGAAIIFAFTGRWQPSKRWLLWCTRAVLVASLLSSLFFLILPTDRARRDLVYRARVAWVSAHEPNVLTRHLILGDRVPGISIPTMTDAISITNEHRTDFHIHLDARGFISISGTPISKHQLEGITQGQLARYGGRRRAFLWLDRSAPAEAQESVISVLASGGYDPIYQVVSFLPESGAQYEHGVILRVPGTESPKPAEDTEPQNAEPASAGVSLGEA